jgi:hypothetical protein
MFTRLYGVKFQILGTTKGTRIVYGDNNIVLKFISEELLSKLEMDCVGWIYNPMTGFCYHVYELSLSEKK